MVDGITRHKSPLFKRGRNVVAEVILPHFRVRPFCVVVLSSFWNPEVPGSNLGTNSALGTSLDLDLPKLKFNGFENQWDFIKPWQSL